MKKYLFLISLFLVVEFGFSQTAPQKNFIEKLAFNDRKTAASLMKAPKNYNGDNYDLKYHRMNWNIDPDTLFISGEVTSYFVTTKSSVNQIRFDFSSVMIVDSVLYHSTKITFSHNSSSARFRKCLLSWKPYTRWIRKFYEKYSRFSSCYLDFIRTFWS